MINDPHLRCNARPYHEWDVKLFRISIHRKSQSDYFNIYWRMYLYKKEKKTFSINLKNLFLPFLSPVPFTFSSRRFAELN